MNPGSSGDAPPSRFDVQSADRTSLAVWVEGEGPALVMVHGSLQDHTGSSALVDELRSDVATFSMDRRGFGESGDATGYAVEREFEDVAAVVDAVAARTGGPVALWGHSYGAGCALGGAALTPNVHHLVLYEPSLGLVYPPGSIEAIEHQVAAGEMEAALHRVLVEVIGMPEEEVAAMRSDAEMAWAARLETVPTVPRECRAENDWAYRPGQFDNVTVPTLMLAGSESDPVMEDATEQAAAAIADVHIRVLEGHGHFAHRSDPVLVAAIVTEFITS